MRDRALAFWLEHPSEAIILYMRKLAYLWTWRPGVGGLYARSWTVLYLGIWLLALPAMLAGAWLAKRNASSEGPLLFLGTWAFLSLVYALFAVNMRFHSPAGAAAVIGAMGRTAVLFVVPPPAATAVANAVIDSAVSEALARAEAAGISGNEVTPYVLDAIDEATAGRSVDANVELVVNNARCAAAIAVAAAT